MMPITKAGLHASTASCYNCKGSNVGFLTGPSISVGSIWQQRGIWPMPSVTVQKSGRSVNGRSLFRAGGL